MKMESVQANSPACLAGFVPMGGGLDVEAGPFGTFRPSPPTVPVERILRIQGYGDLQRVRPAIRKAAELVGRRAEELAVPQVGYRRVAVRSCRDAALELEGGTVFHCCVFTCFLDGCTHVVPFVLTAGPRLDAEVMALAESGEGLLEALLLETAGWLCIEDATRQFKRYLRDEAARCGYRLSIRMGPGYSYRHRGVDCEWPLQEQKQLFGLFEGVALPVQLLASGAMLPKMSRSGLFGMGPRAHSEGRDEPGREI